MIGHTLDKYEVLQKIGEGGMATVYRGKHCTLGREVAIKVLHPHLSCSVRNRKRFAREARAIEHLRHDNILEIFDYSGSDSDDCYIVTEFVEGENLTDLLHRVGPMPSEVVALIGLHLARALAYAHEAGILHRDLKPDNVMLRRDGTVKLMDFGIARFLDESQVTMTGALVGSPAFMSPEQAREADLDPRSDLFSLGTLLFYLLTGHLPFAGSNPSLILKNIIEGNRPGVSELAPSVSASLAATVDLLLHVDREERPQSARKVEEALQRCLDEVEVKPSEMQWSLVRFLDDPEAWKRRLEDHLRQALLPKAKSLLMAGDHLAALQLLNRLLSIDPENSEVLQLVQGLYAEEAAPARRRARAVVVGTVLAGIAAVGLFALAWSGAPEAQVEPEGPPTPSAAVAAPREPTGAGLAARAAEPPAPAPVPVESAAPAAPEPSEPGSPKSTPIRINPMRPPGPARLPTLAPATATAAAPLDDTPALVELRVSPPFWADIYEDGRRIGDTRDREPIRLSPGAHTVVLRSPLMEDRTVHFAVAPGERFLLRDIDLVPKPAIVRLDDRLAADCEVVRDGEAMGTVGALGRRLSLPRPDREHLVAVTCADRVHTQRYAALLVPVVDFVADP